MSGTARARPGLGRLCGELARRTNRRAGDPNARQHESAMAVLVVVLILFVMLESLI